jgi:hypothetical protein
LRPSDAFSIFRFSQCSSEYLPRAGLLHKSNDAQVPLVVAGFEFQFEVLSCSVPLGDPGDPLDLLYDRDVRKMFPTVLSPEDLRLGMVKCCHDVDVSVAPIGVVINFNATSNDGRSSCSDV